MPNNEAQIGDVVNPMINLPLGMLHTDMYHTNKVQVRISHVEPWKTQFVVPFPIYIYICIIGNMDTHSY
jgi:hypothetical protein